MTIMFAGGMTIAIPGETPTAVAQTGTLSVSASAAPEGAFGGPQILEIVVDDPSKNAVDVRVGQPSVTIDDNTVQMAQADTGKWYAYVASSELTAIDDDEPPADAIELGGLAIGTLTGTILDASSSDILRTDVTLTAAPTDGTLGQTTTTISGAWPAVQIFNFVDDTNIAVEYGNEVVNLRYEADLDDLASVSVDRTDVPVDAQVHVTINDFQLNLDPTAKDTWVMNATGDLASYVSARVGAPADTTNDDWQDTFAGDTGELSINTLDYVTLDYGFDDAVTFEETGLNTGVFVSYDDDNESKITISGSDSNTFTVDYAGSDVQIIVDDFDSTLELVTDGAWNAGDTVTVRVYNADLNLNTLVDDDMTLGSDDLPVMTFGSPITPNDVEVVMADGKFGDSMTIGEKTHVITLKTTSMTTNLTVTLGDHLGTLQNSDLRHYTNYLSDFDTTYNAQSVSNEDGTDAVDLKNGISGIEIASGENVDGVFNLTLTATAAMMRDAEFDATMNGGIQTAVAAAQTEFNNTANDNVPSAQSVQSAVAGIDGDAPTAFQTAIDEIDTSVDTATAMTALAAVEAAANEHIRPITATIVADIFTIDGVQNNAIYRALLEETSSDSGVFEGTIEYTMLNQINVNEEGTYEGATSVDDELDIVLNGHPDADTPEVTYGGDHAQADALTHTGEVSFDAQIYGVFDEAIITLVDPDLNVNSDGVDIHTANTALDDPDATLLHISIGDCTAESPTAFTLRESADGSFEGTFDVPEECGAGSSTTGESLSVIYYDFRDESGAVSEWSDSATIGADTGSVSFDRTVYPVPAADSTVTVYVTVEDADFDDSSTSVNRIEMVVAPVTVKIGTTEYKLGDADNALVETSGDTGVFDATLRITNTGNLIEQGSIITVTYKDPTDASGNINEVSDSATFDLRNAVLQSDKSTYVIGQDALLTLIEQDLNLDSDAIETVVLDRIAWDSDAYDNHLDTQEARGAFSPVPSNLRETGKNTGIFQVVITIPEKIPNNDDGNVLERGEEITLTYEDRGPSGADEVSESNARDVELFIETSNFGATLELDQNVYTWTDKVFITVVASDYNFDSNIIDEIGTANDGEITIRIRSAAIDEYNLAETGPDTGVFTGEVRLVGTTFDSGDDNIELEITRLDTRGNGPTDGTIEADNGDGLSVSFEYSDSESPLVASALIRWNVGEVQWLEASYAATGSGIVRVIDPDMNLNPNAVDNLDMVAYSETFLGGITLTVTETQEASGIFEGTVEFDPDEASQGHRLQVTEGDIVTAEYDDTTLPDDDDLTITATTLIGSIVPPLERAPASNPAIVDAFGNSLASVSADQQVQITADLTSGQDRDQDFAYLVQIQNEDGVTIALSWITGTLGAGATFSPSQSWTPSETGSYTATIFVWESVSNPTALSPQLSITIDVV